MSIYVQKVYNIGIKIGLFSKQINSNEIINKPNINALSFKYHYVKFKLLDYVSTLIMCMQPSKQNKLKLFDQLIAQNMGQNIFIQRHEKRGI